MWSKGHHICVIWICNIFYLFSLFKVCRTMNRQKLKYLKLMFALLRCQSIEKKNMTTNKLIMKKSIKIMRKHNHTSLFCSLKAKSSTFKKSHQFVKLIATSLTKSQVDIFQIIFTNRKTVLKSLMMNNLSNFFATKII